MLLIYCICLIMGVTCDLFFWLFIALIFWLLFSFLLFPPFVGEETFYNDWGNISSLCVHESPFNTCCSLTQVASLSLFIYDKIFLVN